MLLQHELVPLLDPPVWCRSFLEVASLHEAPLILHTVHSQSSTTCSKRSLQTRRYHNGRRYRRRSSQ